MHLDFLKLALNILKQTQGVFCIIEPSTWLIQLQPQGAYKELELTRKEIELIKHTIKRYSKNSKWFKRYLESNKSK